MSSLLLLLVVSSPAIAQLAPDRQWTVFRPPMSPVPNDIHSILVDDDVLWFGTDQGVSRFNGRWQSFPIALISRHTSTRHLQGAPGNVTALEVASGGGIWVGTDQGYVARLVDDRWSVADVLYSPIHDLLEVNGVLWLATGDGLRMLRDGVTQQVPNVPAVPAYDLQLESGAVWLGAHNGLWRLSPTGSIVQHIGLQVSAAETSSPIQALWGDGHGTLWLGLGRRIVQFSTINFAAIPFDPLSSAAEDVVITSIVGVADEGVWIATDGAGVVQYPFEDGDPAAAGHLGSAMEGGLDTKVVRALAIDQDGTIWFASPVGVYRYQPWAWRDVDSRVEDIVVNDLLYDHNGDLWVATDNEGLQRRKSLYVKPKTYYPGEVSQPSAPIYDLEQDTANRLWVATSNGIAQFSNDKWSFPIAGEWLPSNSVLRLKADLNGLWIGTVSGLAHYAFATHVVSEEPGFAGRAITSMEIDNLGRLWVAARNGGLWLHTQDGDWKTASFISKGMPPGAMVTAFMADPESAGGMYAAFQGAGIYRWNGTNWSRVELTQSMPGARVQALSLEPSDGSLWIGSEIDLSRVDHFGLTTYDLLDGRQNGAVRAILREPGGAYWFGGERGLAHYRPEHTAPWIGSLDVSTPDTRTATDSWQVFVGQPFVISYQVGDIQTSPEKLKVFYRLRTPDAAGSWHETDRNSLDLLVEMTGQLELEMMVRDQAFNYSQSITKTIIAVAPPTVVEMPIFGNVDTRVFQLLILFGTLTLLGFGYVSAEILRRRFRVSAAVRRGYNPYISGEPVRSEDMFFGRHELVQRIVATLHNNSIMIHGERRIGKTTMLYQLSNLLCQVNDNQYWFVPVFIDLEGTTEDRLFHLLMEEIAQTVSSLPTLGGTERTVIGKLLFRGIPDVAYTDREFGRDLRTIIELLEPHSHAHYAGRQLRLILLIDEVDTLGTFHHIYQQQMRRIFMRDFAASVGAVVAGIAISKEWDRVESPWFNLFNEIAMQPFSRDDAVELLVEPVHGYYVYETEALDAIIDLSQGRPYRIQQLALEAVNHMLKDKRRRITLEDVLYAQSEVNLPEINAGGGPCEYRT